MELQTVEVNGVKFDVYYTAKVENDPYGTGDSPASCEVDINSIEVGADTQNLLDFLSDTVVAEIEQEIIKLELAGA